MARRDNTIDRNREFWMCWLVVLSLCLAPVAEAQNAPLEPADEQALAEGNLQAREFFKALHRRLGEGARYGEVLRECGYKKEVEEIDTFVDGQFQKRFAELREDAVKSNKLSSTTALLIAQQGTQSAWVGYISGFREAFALSRRLAAPNVNELFCRATLKRARQWLDGAAG